MMVPSVFVSETQKSTSSLAMLDKTVAEENQSKMLNGVSSESFITTLDTHGSIVAGDVSCLAFTISCHLSCHWQQYSTVHSNKKHK